MSIINTSRAIFELRSGRAIQIAQSGFLHPEFGTIPKAGVLIITPHRANGIFGTKFKHNVIIDLKKISGEEAVLAASALKISEKTKSKLLKFAAEDKSKTISAALDLCRIGQLIPSLVSFEKPKKLVKVSATEIAKSKKNQELQLVAEAPLNLRDAKKSYIKAFRPADGSSEHLAIIVGNLGKEPLIRIHSSCYTGDLLGSLSCDCGDQLRGAIKKMDKAGGGIILYLMQEGRGIGLINKIRAYNLQANGMDTVEANEFLGFDDEERGFEPAVEILNKLGVKKVKLITNNPKKAAGLTKHGIKVTELVPMIIKHEHNNRYLTIKAKKSGHLI